MTGALHHLVGQRRADGDHYLQTGRVTSGFVFKFGIFDDHVLYLTSFKDIAALHAFDEFGVFLTSHNLHARVLTLIRGASLLGGLRRRD
jgi:hypothetical protein